MAAIATVPGGVEGAVGLPDLLAALGCTELALPLPPPWPPCWRWTSAGGGSVVVGGGADAEGIPVHGADLLVPDWDGALPVDAWRDEFGAHLARIASADPWCVANPLAVAWSGAVRLPGAAEADRGAVVDDQGRRYATQVVGSDVLVALELDAGQELRLEPIPGGADPTPWTVSDQVLDNGIVRAEFTGGCIVRLCIDGGFVDLGGPLPRLAAADGSPLGPITIEEHEVVASGPVRAEVHFRFRSDDGRRWNLRYRLDAGARHVAMDLGAEVPVPFLAELRLPPRAVACRLRWDLGSELLDLRPDLSRGPRAWRRGWRTAACPVPGGKSGLAIFALAPAALRATDDGVEFAVGDRLALALSASSDGIGELQAATAARFAARSGRLARSVPRIRASGCLPLWCGDDRDRLLVIAGDSGRMALVTEPRPQVRCAENGVRLRHVDGAWQLELAPHAVAVVDC